MILYVVDLEVDAAVRDDYLAWLREHVDEMLALPGFVDAEILERLQPQPPPDCAGYSVRYRLRDQAAFDRHLAEHAPRMREAGRSRFGGRFHASRDVLRTLE